MSRLREINLLGSVDHNNSVLMCWVTIDITITCFNLRSQKVFNKFFKPSPLTVTAVFFVPKPSHTYSNFNHSPSL